MKIFSQENIKSVVKSLHEGHIVAVPTETVYGLAVHADNIQAIQKLLNLKHRNEDSGKILSLMLPEVNYITRYAALEGTARNVAQRYFPDELTLVLPKKPDFDHKYFDHFSSIGIRIPAHEYMLSLLREVGALLVTSANPKGEAPCLTSKAVIKRMPEVDTVVVGRSGGNLPSTVLDFTSPEEPVVLRQGGLLIVHY
ncbi:MAG: threonylcarbamoyl-AMP synthase [Candidatus Nomurabacteria bacterium]|nr:threonylcarbamoyl-AMP synthase [Candidatus Nomurabacteria bacterium]